MEEVVFTVDALARMLTLQRLGSPHRVIEPAPIWRDVVDDRAEEAAMWAEFTEAGWTAAGSRLRAEPLGVLTLLCQAGTEYFAWYTTRKGHQVGVLAAATGQDAALAVRSGSRVGVRGLPNETLAEVLLSQLPQARPARIDVINTRVEALTADVWDTAVAGARDAQRFRELGRAPTLACGELYAGARDHHGRYAVTEEPIRFRDSAAGRVMVRMSGDHVSVAPGSTTRLAQQLRHAYTALTTSRQ